MVQAATEHAPETQAGTPLGALQEMPQRPQFMVSLLGVAQRPRQHELPSPQALPQAPQWAALLLTSTHCSAQQVLPTPQGLASVQPGTHTASRHTVPGMQSMACLHPVQRCVARSQRVTPPPQSSSSSQPVAQALATGSQ